MRQSQQELLFLCHFISLEFSSENLPAEMDPEVPIDIESNIADMHIETIDNEIDDTKATAIEPKVMPSNDIEPDDEEEKYAGIEDEIMKTSKNRIFRYFDRRKDKMIWVMIAVIIFMFQFYTLTSITVPDALIPIIITWILYGLNCGYGLLRTFRNELGERTYECTWQLSFERVLIFLSNHPYFVLYLESHRQSNPNKRVHWAEAIFTLVQV